MEIICYSCGRGENPENSIEGVKHCLEVNPDWRIEMDLQMTKDGQIVLFHDYETIRTTGIENKIQEMDLGSVKKLNAGYNFKVGSGFPYRQNPIEIPTLEEVCQSFPNAKLLLDIHTDNLNAIDKIIKIIEQYGMEKQIVMVSHYDQVSAEFKAKRPNWKFGASTKEIKKMVYSSFLFLDNLFPIKSDILMLPVKFGNIKLLTNRVINHVTKRNKRLWVWLSEGKEVITVNSKMELDELEKIGANGIFTEYPAKLNEEITVDNNVL
ncbi:glycerophosphodiester phosphodiesterase family protein [Flavivirga aquimarina]|uniref:Glycerophosphodiester phosphodiesterase family protein n=1 Tax=Flavivirga aquimarina TaxID=2027862 RepID=A0ABT8WE96_9FLAO|nr:glycerophosphodiester phosphodiesterase family protein [Flavivirga aquimarina]MDO5971377.1 glycerophosphodiester phosphodiesterase family protein [Flavivirga aquimarina]